MFDPKEVSLPSRLTLEAIHSLLFAPTFWAVYNKVKVSFIMPIFNAKLKVFKTALFRTKLPTISIEFMHGLANVELSPKRMKSLTRQLSPL